MVMIDDHVDRHLYPFESRWFPSANGLVHYVDEGSGPTIVFCHGSPTWSFLFRDVITRLRSDYRCIAPDMLGFGLSERPERFGYTAAEQVRVLGELLDHLEVDDYILVSHDWGGPIGIAASVPRADRVRGLVLTNTCFWPITRTPNRVFSAVMGSSTMQRRIVERNFLVERVLLGPFGPRLTDSEADQYRLVQPTPASRSGLAVMPTEITSAAPLLMQLEDDVARTLHRRPVLVVWGLRDRVFPARDALPRIRTAFDDVTCVKLPKVGHFTAEEAPDELAEAIAERFPVRAA